jgi:hypothetical protein
MLAMVVALMIGGAGCKTRKKTMEISGKANAKTSINTEEEALRKQKEDEMRRREALEKAKRDAEASERKPYVKLDEYFNAIASSANPSSANSSIDEALTMFASDDTPVLIVISNSGGQKDYDRPTTIKAYLNYLKDQKKNVNKIEALQFDSSGKITDVELVKQK